MRWQVALVSTLLAGIGPARAEQLVYKHDQFSADLATAASQVSGTSLSVQPGFARGEAYAQIFHPDPAHYPIKILGVDLILAAPPSAGDLVAETEALIEIWQGDGDGPAPEGSAPVFSVSTNELLNPVTGESPMPLTGGAAVELNFDYDNQQDHPPLITEGNIWVVVRFNEDAQSLAQEWGDYMCMQISGMTCGCQKVGLLVDGAVTPHANALNYLTPMGSCSSSNSAWGYFEDTGIAGDALLRLRVDVAAAATDAGPAVDAARDGGVAQDGAADDVGDAGAPADAGARDLGHDAALTDAAARDTAAAIDSGATDRATGVVVAAVSPDFGYEDEATAVSVTGQGFAAGAAVRLGATDLEEIAVEGAGLISAVVPSGLYPARYMLVVTNPDGSSGFLENAFEVRARGDQDSGDRIVREEGGCGCAGAAGAGGSSSLLLLFAVWLRRRRS